MFSGIKFYNLEDDLYLSEGNISLYSEKDKKTNQDSLYEQKVHYSDYINSVSNRSTSARMASAIERAVQRVKGERASGVVGDREVMVPQASVKQCYKGHRNARCGFSSIYMS